MSKLIVEMEMPQGCDDCPFRDMLLCRCAKGRKYVGSSPVRPDWCPIVGVLPEHGDLIDRDQFKENLDMVCYAGGWLNTITQAVRDYCKKQVDAEKTIVPATERSET